MPFHEIKTDEHVPGASKREKDFETQIMRGCAATVVLSVLVYGITIWPFFALPEHTVEGLFAILAFGMIPSTILGVFAIRKIGYGGFSGFVGGALTSAAFIYLRLQQTMLAKVNPNLPAVEYPERWVWLVPLAWVLFAIVVGLIACPDPLGREGDPRTVR